MIVNSHCRDKEYLCEISVTVRYSVLTQTWWYTLGWLQWGHSLSISNTLSINTQCCNTKFVQTKNGAMGPSPETQDVKHFGTSVRRSSRPAFGRSTGNDVSGHYKHHYLSFCQAQPISSSSWLRLAFSPAFPHPPSHPATHPGKFIFGLVAS